MSKQWPTIHFAFDWVDLDADQTEADAICRVRLSRGTWVKRENITDPYTCARFIRNLQDPNTFEQESRGQWMTQSATEKLLSDVDRIPTNPYAVDMQPAEMTEDLLAHDIVNSHEQAFGEADWQVDALNEIYQKFDRVNIRDTYDTIYDELNRQHDRFDDDINPLLEEDDDDDQFVNDGPDDPTEATDAEPSPLAELPDDLPF